MGDPISGSACAFVLCPERVFSSCLTSEDPEVQPGQVAAQGHTAHRHRARTELLRPALAPGVREFSFAAYSGGASPGSILLPCP